MSRERGDLKPISEILGESRRVKSVIKPLSKTELRLVKTAEDIRLNMAEEISFLHTVFCQTGLPYRETADRRIERRNGRLLLEIEAGRALDPETEKYIDLPLPYGPAARLILIYLCSTAVQSQNRLIEVDKTMTAFITQLQGREPNGKEIRKFKQQIAAISGATIRIATVIEGKSLQLNNQMVGKFDLLLKKDDYTQRVLWPETVELTEDFFSTLQRHAVPLDHRAVASLAHSALALDIYAWLAQRLRRIQGTSDALVTWVNLYEQFGSTYKQIRQFRKAFLDTLRDVLSQYPTAQVKVTGEGLILKKSPPPISSSKLIGS